MLKYMGNVIRTSSQLVFMFSASCFGQQVCSAQEVKAVPQLELVQANAEDQPRMTPTTRLAMKQYLEDLKNRKPRIPLPEFSESEKKKALEDPRATGYESRLRSNYLSDATNAYLTFGGSPARGFSNSPGRVNNPPDPKLSLDYGFKVRMFWIAARANNCQYCLGHQESKLLAEGMNEDAIASLDSDWSAFPENERVAFELAKTLTSQPYLVGDKQIDACKKHYSDLQIVEMLGSIAGNNAINRWKEGAGIPQSSNGGNFGGSRGSAQSTSLEHSYLTATSDKFASTVSKVAVFNSDQLGTQSASTKYLRPALEVGKDLDAKLHWVKTRKPRLPVADEVETREVLGEIAGEHPEQWMRLLAQFPIAGKRLVDGVVASKISDQLQPELQAKIDWVVARQDGAWYMTALAKRDLEKLPRANDLMKLLDDDFSVDSKLLTERDRSLLIVAKNLAASPIVLTDKQVNEAVKIAGPRAVTQVINYTCYRASLDRMTEAAGLSL